MIPMEYLYTMTDCTSWNLVGLPDGEMTVAEVIDWLMKNDRPEVDANVYIEDRDFRLRYKDGKILGYDKLTIDRFRNKKVARVLANGYANIWSYSIELQTIKDIMKAKG
jgi:hypothetical protein